MYCVRTLFTVGACLAYASLINALAFTNWPALVISGEPVTLTWAGGDPAAATILTLRKGESADLHEIKVLATAATGGTFSWTPDETLEEGKDYAFEIKQNDAVNYSGYFTLAHSRNQIPASVGPAPARFDPHSPQFDTSPKDAFGTHVIEGNDAESVTMTSVRQTPTVVDISSEKNIAQAQMNRASVRDLPVELALGAIAVLVPLLV
ncbi:Ser-Thr-rich glycosyl-phosphatidyl-inositol-anchored membrane family-domain-containing protein [Aspergillus floccosus]